MSTEDFIEKMKKELPDICSVKNLIEKGIYSTVSQALAARKNRSGPTYFQAGNRKRIFYPKDSVISWLKEGIHEHQKETYKF